MDSTVAIWLPLPVHSLNIHSITVKKNHYQGHTFVTNDGWDTLVSNTATLSITSRIMMRMMRMKKLTVLRNVLVVGNDDSHKCLIFACNLWGTILSCGSFVRSAHGTCWSMIDNRYLLPNQQCPGVNRSSAYMYLYMYQGTYYRW